MNYFVSNIEHLLGKSYMSKDVLCKQFAVTNISDIRITDLERVADYFSIDAVTLLKTDLAKKHNLSNIKLLILDVDGVMTDGGMYFTESGDQMKKYNTKDGMAIIHMTKKDFQVGIISSGFKGEMVKSRADLLGIQHYYLGRGKKIEVLETWCADLNIELSNVAMIGDDINDLEIMSKIGFSACPSDAVDSIKQVSDVILTKQGGKGCVREFIDNYLLENPI